jgi:hypothetical protein
MGQGARQRSIREKEKKQQLKIKMQKEADLVS